MNTHRISAVELQDRLIEAFNAHLMRWWDYRIFTTDFDTDEEDWWHAKAMTEMSNEMLETIKQMAVTPTMGQEEYCDAVVKALYSAKDLGVTGNWPDSVHVRALRDLFEIIDDLISPYKDMSKSLV